MAPLLTFVALLISTTFLITASVDFGTPRLPNGGALFSLSSRQIMPRQGLADCGGDPDCTPQAWGCQCGFGDDSWLDGASGPGGPGSGHPAISSAAPPAPTSTPAPAPFPSASAKPNPPLVTCKVTGFVCHCSDGSHPDMDEGGRYYISNDDGHGSSHCFSSDGGLVERK